MSRYVVDVPFPTESYRGIAKRCPNCKITIPMKKLEAHSKVCRSKGSSLDAADTKSKGEPAGGSS
ncbi:hypothetical protein QCA50_007208 [Cerrena zonata]|uniref:Uncharacterized protein n=1 Tax=Cerrena zonata TaxID=2478898 RepID=A0AAW0GIX5_9APHY